MSKREDILARVVEILNTVQDIKFIARNLDEFPEVVRPAVILLDGDQEAVPELQHSWIKGKAWIIIDMAPLIVLSIGGTPEEVGTDINELEARIITAIMSDNDLAELVTTNGGVFYTASDYRLNHSLAMDCDRQIRFRIRYPLLPTHP